MIINVTTYTVQLHYFILLKLSALGIIIRKYKDLVTQLKKKMILLFQVQMNCKTSKTVKGII